MDRSHKLRSGDSVVNNKTSDKKRKIISDHSSENVSRGDNIIDDTLLSLVDKVVRESIPIVLVGVPDSKVKNVSHHLKDFHLTT